MSRRRAATGMRRRGALSGRGQPGYMGPWITFTKPQWNEWGRLAEHLRTKDLKVMGAIDSFTVADAGVITVQPTRSAWVLGAASYARSTSRRAGGSWISAAVRAPTASRRRRRSRHPRGGARSAGGVRSDARVLAENGVGDRVEAEPCNFTRDPFPTDCDVAIMASNLPMYSREMIAAVIERRIDALLPGGEMHLIGETPTTSARDRGDRRTGVLVRRCRIRSGLPTRRPM